ncbi:hypothetical protein BGZ80_007607, partial [Entomortierella chlamydospora]
MAVAMQTKKKLKDRTRQRRAFEEEDEDMVIISRLENEPWQPDLLLERQSDKINHIDHPDQRYMAHQSSPYSPLTSLTAPTTDSTTNAKANGSSVQQSSGFQGVIPVIIKSPSSVITTVDSDEDIFEDHAPKMPGIEEYLQQTHQRQQLLQQQQRQQQQQQQQQQEEMQMQMQLQLQYQMPAHLQTNNASNNFNNRRQQSRLHQDLVPQQYRNSFHGHTGTSHFDMEKEDEDEGEEEERPILQLRSLSVHEPSIRSESPMEKVMSDDE